MSTELVGKPNSTSGLDRRDLTAEQLADLPAAEGVAPNTADIPEAPERKWEYARRLFKPRKEAISLRLDAEVLDWLRRKHPRYQSEINRVLRERTEYSSLRF